MEEAKQECERELAEIAAKREREAVEAKTELRRGKGSQGRPRSHNK